MTHAKTEASCSSVPLDPLVGLFDPMRPEWCVNLRLFDDGPGFRCTAGYRPEWDCGDGFCRDGCTNFVPGDYVPPNAQLTGAARAED